MIHNRVVKKLWLMILLSLLAACGGGGGSGPAPVIEHAPAPKTMIEVFINSPVVEKFINGKTIEITLPYDPALIQDGFMDITDISRLLNVRPDQAEAKRVEIINALFGGGLSSVVPVPAEWEAYFETVVDYPGGFTAHTYYVVYEPPGDWNGRVIILHHGHANTFLYDAGAFFLDHGWAVILMTQPMMDINTVHYNGVQLEVHDDLLDLETPDFNPIALFIDPPVMAVNLSEALFPGAPVGIMGLSGGGWTALVAGAIDNRLTFSVSVSGWQPFYLNLSKHTGHLVGDYEQVAPNLFTRFNVNYLDLAVIASMNGRHIQGWLVHDTSNFDGYGYLTYAPQLEAITGGRYGIIVDETFVGHDITPEIMEKVLGELP